MSPSIFISYRRSDAAGHAGRLHDRLAQWFDTGELFYDQRRIEPGDAFWDCIDGAIRGARVLLAVIAPGWLDALNQRLQGSDADVVRRELELALHCRTERGLVLIPLLMGGAAMPAPSELAEPLREGLGPLLGIDAMTLGGKDADWSSQFLRLRQRLEAVPGVPAARYRPPSGVVRPWQVAAGIGGTRFHDPDGRLPALLAAWGRPNAAAGRLALVGMHGVGKTRLALQCAQAVRDEHAGVWWLRADSDAGLQEDARAACAAAGFRVDPAGTGLAALWQGLRQAPAPWLLVFDNAPDAAALAPSLAELPPAADGRAHRVLITSCHPAWGALAAVFPLEPWSPEQGAAFLAGRLAGIAAASGTSPDPRSALSDELGGLPLALEQAAGYLERSGRTPAGYLELLRDRRHGERLLDRPLGADSGLPSVAATLSLAFDRLSPAARALLGLCAWAAPEPLPESVLTAHPDALAPPLAAAAADPLDWDDTVAELIGYALMQRTPWRGAQPGDTGLALRMHRLTQRVARSRLAAGAAAGASPSLPTAAAAGTAQALSTTPSTGAAAPEASATAMPGAGHDALTLQALLAAAFPAEPQAPASWPMAAMLAPHVEHLDALAGVTAPAGDGLLAPDIESRLLDATAGYRMAGPSLHASAIALYRRALAIDTARLGPEHLDTLGARNNLASALFAAGRYDEARVEQQAVVDRLRARPEPRGPAWRRALGNLAGTLMRCGRLGEALAIQRELVGVTATDVPNDDETLVELANLAGTLGARGHRQAAAEIERAVLRGCEQRHGADDPLTLNARHNLGSTLRHLGALDEARTLQEAALEGRRRVLGPGHADTLTTMNNLAITWWQSGRRADGEALMDQALAGRLALLGPAHPHTLDSRRVREQMRQAATRPDATRPAGPAPAGAVRPPSR